jgi:hypothetical protein
MIFISRNFPNKNTLVFTIQFHALFLMPSLRAATLCHILIPSNILSYDALSFQKVLYLFYAVVILFLFLVIFGIEPRTLQSLGKHSIT